TAAVAHARLFDAIVSNSALDQFLPELPIRIGGDRWLDAGATEALDQKQDWRCRYALRHYHDVPQQPAGEWNLTVGDSRAGIGFEWPRQGLTAELHGLAVAKDGKADRIAGPLRGRVSGHVA